MILCLNKQIVQDQSWSHNLAKGKEQCGNLKSNLQFLQKTNLIHPHLNILEIGCGIGTVVDWITQKGCCVIGTDISSIAIEYGKNKYSDANLKIQSAENLDFEDRSFDLVISLDLIEHIKDVGQHIKEVRRVLRNEGWYLLSTPNKYLDTIYETLTHKNLNWKHFHVSLHTPTQWKKQFHKYDFKCKFMKINTINEFTLNKIRKFGRWTELLKYIDISRLPLCIQTNLYIMAQKTFVLNSNENTHAKL